MPNQIKIRRDTASNFQTEDPTLGSGEFSLETDTSKIKVGDGSTAYNSLEFIDGDAAVVTTLIVQGQSTGFVVGGSAPGLSPEGVSGKIDSFSLTSDENATNVGDMTTGYGDGKRAAGASSTSEDHGYVSGGYREPGAGSNRSEIYKYAFTSPYTAIDTGDLSPGIWFGFGTSSRTDGYCSGGLGGAPYSATQSIHQKFPFASNSNSSDNGDLSAGRYSEANGGNSSELASYFAGGRNTTTFNNIIDKIPFSAGGTATDVGNLTVSVTSASGANTLDNGYAFSLNSLPASQASHKKINKFSYSSDGDATYTQDLFLGVFNGSGVSSGVSGYSIGGLGTPDLPGVKNEIQKFPFANDNTGTSVGDLVSVIAFASTSQT